LYIYTGLVLIERYRYFEVNVAFLKTLDLVFRLMLANKSIY